MNHNPRIPSVEDTRAVIDLAQHAVKKAMSAADPIIIMTLDMYGISAMGSVTLECARAFVDGLAMIAATPDPGPNAPKMESVLATRDRNKDRLFAGLLVARCDLAQARADYKALTGEDFNGSVSFSAEAAAQQNAMIEIVKAARKL